MTVNLHPLHIYVHIVCFDQFQHHKTCHDLSQTGYLQHFATIITYNCLASPIILHDEALGFDFA